MTENKRVHRLTCQAMNYKWGKLGNSSLIYQFLEKDHTSSLNPKLPYAELWMGDHPSQPSILRETNDRISKILEPFTTEPNNTLPFLFKILSVQKPLSLQCHPNLEQAQILHQKDPSNYPDPNHKPECGLFLTKGALLYGIREYQQIIEFFNKIPELQNLISQEALHNFAAKHDEDSFRILFREFMTVKPDVLKTNLDSFKARYKTIDAIDPLTKHAIDLIIENFPDDGGIFIPFILNVEPANPGEVVLIPTGTLHAYLEGDLIEAMALSDNVVRAGMTPKFVDVETLLTIMSFKPLKPVHLHPTPENIGNVKNSVLNYYSTGYDSFNLESGVAAPNEKFAIPAKKHASIILILNGKCKLDNAEYSAGSVLLVLPQTSLSIESIGNENTDFYICSSQ